MKHINELQDVLFQFFKWNKARIACLAQILQALFCVKTVNLTKIASAFQVKAKEESAYRRIQRFFKIFNFDISSIVSFVLTIFPLQGKYILILDRTNWKWGKKHINILMLSCAYLGIGIPLLWIVLDKGGNSSKDDRVCLIHRALEKFGVERIEALLADREFIGEPWFRFLIEYNIPFVIRIKQGFMAGGIRNGYDIPVKMLIKNMGKNKTLINYPIVLWGLSLYVLIRCSKKAKEPMIVVSNRLFKNPIILYRRRWEIETLFGCLKTRGFCMEDTHMTDNHKIEKLVFVLTIGFCWAYKMGSLQVKQKTISLKAHGRKAKSIFRIGVDLIRSSLFSIVQNFNKFICMLACLTNLKSMRSSL